MTTFSDDWLNGKVRSLIELDMSFVSAHESLVAAWAESRSSEPNDERAVWVFATKLRDGKYFSLIRALAMDLVRMPKAAWMALAADLFGLLRDFDEAFAAANDLRFKFPESPQGDRVYVQSLIALGRKDEAAEILTRLPKSIAKAKWVERASDAVAAHPEPIALAQTQPATERLPPPVTQRPIVENGFAHRVTVPAMAVPLFVFLHIPKTAGTSFRWILMKQFGEYYHLLGDEIYKPEQDAAPTPWNSPGFFDDKLAIAGHIERDHRVIEAVQGRRIIFVSLMREPVERVVSLYDYLRGRKVHPLNEWLSSRSLLQAITEPGKFRDGCVNYQLKAIFGQSCSDDFDTHLKANNYIIGKSENLTALVNAVTAISGVAANRKIPVFNTKQENRQAIEVGEQLLEARQQPDFADAVAKIRAANSAEYGLYDRIGESVIASFALTPPPVL